MNGTSVEHDLYSKFLLEVVFLRWNICENSFQFVRSIFTEQACSPYSIFVYIFGWQIKSVGRFIMISCDEESSQWLQNDKN